jgi:hypothetical protein
LLSQPVPLLLIFGSFVFLTLPFTAAALVDESFRTQYRWLELTYIWLFSSTHAVLTLSVYLQTGNLRHFNRSWKNRVLYFAIPLAILVLFDLFVTFRVALVWPYVGLLVFAGIRLADFHHFGRQSYGVLQMFKGPGKAAFPTWLRQAENYYFFGVTSLLWLVYLSGGHLRPEGFAPWVREAAYFMVALLGCLLALILGGFVMAWRRSPNRRALLAPFSYVLLQTVCAGLAFYDITFYFFALAIHFAEYHVLMYPRCFKANLDPTQKLDRWYARLRSRKAIFYGVLLAVAGYYTYRLAYGMASMAGEVYQAQAAPIPPWLFAIALFDGLFLFHYFVESLIWKFSDPYYRQSLAGLYFPAAAPARPAV